MTRSQHKRILNKQIKELNEKIDLKIVYGQSYKAEAKRHKMLFKQAQKLKREMIWYRLLNYLTFNRNGRQLQGQTH